MTKKGKELEGSSKSNTVARKVLYRWVWELDGSGQFPVGSCRRLMTEYAVPYFPFQRVKRVPKKINLSGWRVEQERLPTLVGLHKRRIHSGSTLCTFCNGGDEMQHTYSHPATLQL
ncbi:hypothetical protein Hanom_Chr01g00024021 [Helianthus anomalus]